VRLAAYALAEQRQIFPQVQLRPQFGDSRLALDHDFRSGRFEHPARERILSAARARSREAVRTGLPSEQIEIFRIRMRGIAEALARLAGTGPAVLDSSDTTLVVSPPRARRIPGRRSRARDR